MNTKRRHEQPDGTGARGNANAGRTTCRFFPPVLTGSVSAWLAAAFLVLSASLARAEIREPDNVLYGTITLDNVPVTAARPDVVIEARRVTNGAPIVSYRMGANPRIGNFYELDLPLESLTPVSAPAASRTGDSLIISVRDASGVRGQTVYVLGERGQIQRVDLHTGVSDSDGDALPDAWELLQFGNLSRSGGSIAPNGLTLLQNFVSGANPSGTNNLCELQSALSNGQKTVSFLALRAEGAGYEGRSRFYALETSADLTAGSWIGVPSFTNLPGNNQILTFQTAETNSPAFYRVRVWLEGP